MRYRRGALHLHGVHSPFVYALNEQVITHSGQYYCYNHIESARKKLLQNHSKIKITDMGAGSAKLASDYRKISDIATTSLKAEKFGQLFFRLAQHFECKNILEIGTSLGITTSYLAAADTSARVVTLEGCPQIAGVAQSVFDTFGLDQIELIQGNFDDTLDAALEKCSPIDLAYIDGNHRKGPTLEYFEKILNKCHNGSLIIVDDIYWSKEMATAWNEIKKHPTVTLTIDLYQLGLVFLRKEQAKQDFVLPF